MVNMRDNCRSDWVRVANDTNAAAHKLTEQNHGRGFHIAQYAGNTDLGTIKSLDSLATCNEKTGLLFCDSAK